MDIRLDDDGKLFDAFAQLIEQRIERNLGIGLELLFLSLVFALIDEFLRHAFIGHDAEFFTGIGGFGKTRDFHRRGRSGFLDGFAGVIAHGAHTADSGSGNDHIAAV